MEKIIFIPHPLLRKKAKPLICFSVKSNSNITLLKDLKKIGMSEGKKIGQIIKTTRDWWINNDCMPDKNKCISFIKKL